MTLSGAFRLPSPAVPPSRSPRDKLYMIRVFVPTCIYICVCAYVCIYIYMHIYVYAY